MNFARGPIAATLAACACLALGTSKTPCLLWNTTASAPTGLGLNYAETRHGERIEGIYRRRLDLVSGKYALIENAREFQLVPWRPVLERNLGRQVSGIMRGDTISWMIGRQRSGPEIS